MKLSYIESKIFGKVCYGFRRNNNGIVETIPDKAKVVEEWQKNHPDGKKADCIRDTGLSKPTVYRWWKQGILEKATCICYTSDS